MTNPGGSWSKWFFARELERPLHGDANWGGSPVFWAVMVTLLALGLERLVAACLLGQLRNATMALRSGGWWKDVREHYLSLLLLATTLRVAVGLAWGAATVTILRAMTLGTPGWYLWRAAMCLPGVVLILAPFAIVARKVGPWQGAREGILMLRGQAAPVAALLATALLATVAINLAGWGAAPAMSVPILLYHWVLWMAQSVVGLWLATALFIVVAHAGPDSRGDAVPG